MEDLNIHFPNIHIDGQNIWELRSLLSKGVKYEPPLVRLALILNITSVGKDM